jgi:hypothetical protein
MSSWGLKDREALAGTAATTTLSNVVTGTSTFFVGNVNMGDYITLQSRKYQVEQVVTNTSLYLTSVGAANVSGQTAYVQTGPKYISNVSPTENVYTIQRVYGVDATEINVANAAANASHTGWIHYSTYTDAFGNVRKKSEVLVALSKNFTAASAGDGADDEILPDAA